MASCRTPLEFLAAVLLIGELASGCVQSSDGARGATSTGGASTCATEARSNQFDPCLVTKECGCPYLCVVDAFAFAVPDTSGAELVCEMPCQSNTDCVSIFTSCVGGVCRAVACGGDAGNGAYNSTCSMGTEQGEGSCVVLLGADSGLGLCFQAGTSDGGCDSIASDRSEVSTLCVPGSICGVGADGRGQCAQMCDDMIPCKGNLKCYEDATDPPTGVCD